MKAHFGFCLVVLTISFAGCGKKPAPAAVVEATPSPSPESSQQAPPPETNAGGLSQQQQRPGGGNPGERARQRLEQMQASLGLSEEQAGKIKAVFESQRPAMQALRDDQSLSRDQRREKMMELRKTADAEISAILTPEQKTKWEEMRQQFRDRMGNGRGGERGGPPPAN